jgi:NTP pyrophosphatase (non-canonical NTP hydrolase)
MDNFNLWSSKAQNRMDLVKSKLNFPQNMMNFVLGIMQDSGELATEIAKKEGCKKLKEGDDTSNLKEKIGFELADLLVWIYQIGSYYGLDVEEIFFKKLEVLEKRVYK